jgi:formylglycine-generating enzyme required for sulfatase activity
MAAWLTKTDQENHLLPTEAEWEYPCRVGTTTLHYAGDDLEWLEKNATCAQMHRGTTPVDRYLRNPWGLYDMLANCWEWVLGNCWEWVADRYDATYYRTASANDPTGPPQGSYRVFRGGSWWNPESDSRSGCRFYRGASSVSLSRYIYKLPRKLREHRTSYTTS